MKKILLLGAVVLFVISGKGQVNMYGQIEDAYRTFMLNSHSQFNRALLNDFMGVGGDKRFMSNYWLNGGATNNFDVTISTNYLFNYDFLGHELHAKWRDTTIVVNTNYVKRFFLEENNVNHNFVKSPPIDPQGKYFFESIGFNEATRDSGKVVQLLKLRTIKQVKANKNDYLANFSGDYDDKLDNDIVYYIVLPDNSFTKVKLNKKSLNSALSNYKEKLTTFYNSYPEINEESAGALIRYINK